MKLINKSIKDQYSRMRRIVSGTEKEVLHIKRNIRKFEAAKEKLAKVKK